MNEYPCQDSYLVRVFFYGRRTERLLLFLLQSRFHWQFLGFKPGRDTDNQWCDFLAGGLQAQGPRDSRRGIALCTGIASLLTVHQRVVGIIDCARNERKVDLFL